MSKIRLPNTHLLIIRRKAPHENRRITSTHRLQCCTSRLQTLVRDFDDFALLGVEPHGFNGRDVEECGIEVCEVAGEEVAS